MEDRLIIRKLQTTEEMRLIQQLESAIWHTDPIPTHQTFTAAKNGGLILGVFLEEELVGFSYGFPGYVDGKVYLCSHMLGTHPNHQQKGIGKILKDHQLLYARQLGYDLITWTFDPLESRNAYLNLSKLYAICNTYLENCYGEMEDGLNKGLPTDRFQVEWWINSERVTEQKPSKVSEYARPFKVKETEKGNPVLHYVIGEVVTNAEGIEVPVPENIQQIKKMEPELALDWRMKTREVFQTLFSVGYVLVNVRRTSEGIHYYQLVKKNESQ